MIHNHFGIGLCLLNSFILLSGLTVSQPIKADEPGLIQEDMRDFKKSDIEFLRSHSYVPSFPLATIGVRNYTSFELEGDGVTQASFELEQLYLSAGLPILMDKKDALAIGGYLSHNYFSSKDAKYPSFHVNSVGIPLAWLRQVNPNWQTAAFVMPMANKSSLDNSDWSWQTLGGLFGRYVQSETLWWAFGFYLDVGGSENTYLPYLGASWEVNEHWSINAMLPWPSVLYAPDDNWLFTLGASPSGTSWEIDNKSGEANINFDAWDFGLTLERRIVNNVWISLNGGLGGIRGLRVSGSQIHGIDTQVSSSGYIGLNLNYRPEL